jgi:hypothetical protein
MERIVLLALVVASAASRLDFKFLTSIDSRETFIALLYLATGKLVSCKAFDLIKDRMTKKKKRKDH